MSRFLADLEKALAESVEKPPKHMKTVHMIAAEESLKPRAVRERLAVLIAKAGWIRRDYKIRSGGQIRPVPHYGPRG